MFVRPTAATPPGNALTTKFEAAPHDVITLFFALGGAQQNIAPSGRGGAI